MAIFVKGLTGGAKEEDFKYKIIDSNMTLKGDEFTGTDSNMNIVLGNVTSASGMFLNSSIKTLTLDTGNTCTNISNLMGGYSTSTSVTSLHLKIGTSLLDMSEIVA